VVVVVARRWARPCVGRPVQGWTFGGSQLLAGLIGLLVTGCSCGLGALIAARVGGRRSALT